MATEFNINDFIGGGSAATFGNFGDTSTPADLFTPAPPRNPADFFNFENRSDIPGSAFSGRYQNNVAAPEYGSFVDQLAGDTLSALQQYGGSIFGGNNFGSPNFSAMDTALRTARNRGLFGEIPRDGTSYTEALGRRGELFRNIREANKDLVDFRARTFDPVVSSVPGPGLEPFNRFNPTTQQFEEFYGNPAARLPSADVFVRGETGFDDTDRFLAAAMARLNENAKNYIGKPLSEEQKQQAAELFQLLDAGFMQLPTDDQGILQPIYGPGIKPFVELEDFYSRDGKDVLDAPLEDLNALLNMQKRQQAQADNQRRMEFMKTNPTFLGAMADMNKAQEESRAAYNRASALQQQALENRVPFGATFNYDDQGNRVLAGADARAAAATTTGQQPMTFEEAKKFVAKKFREPTNIYNQRVRSFMAQSNKLMEEEGKAVVEEVATFKNAMGSIGVTMERLGFDDAAIAAGVKSAGSGINFARQMASILKDMPDQQTAEEFTTSTNETLNEVSIKTPKQYMIKETGEITTLGFGPGGSLARVFPPKFDERGNMISNRRIEEFGNDEVQLYETGDFRADQETLNTLEAEITGADTQALDKLIDFRDLRAQSAQGLEKLITDIGRTYKTIMQKGLTEAEMIEAVTSAKFEGLLGTVRLEVLGPGVLTEQDAVRLIKAMGGFGFTANRKAAVRILDDIIESKEKILRAKINQYNDYRTSNLALRNLKDTEGNIRFPEIKFESRLKPPPLVQQ